MAPVAKHLGTLAVVGDRLLLPVDGFARMGIQLAGTWSGTIDFAGSVDGLTFAPLLMTPLGSVTAGVTSATANGIWQTSSVLRLFSVTASALASGSVLVSASAIQKSGLYKTQAVVVVTSALLLENGNGLLLEDSSGKLALE